MVVALAILAAVAPAAQAAKRSTLTVALPSPGHVTVAAVSVKVRAGRPAGLARHFRVAAKRLGSLPPSVKVLTAQRFIRQRHGGTYAAAVFVVNRAGGAAGGARAGLRTAGRPTFLEVLFENEDQCDSCGYRFSEDELSGGICSACQMRRAIARAEAVKNVDLLPAPPKPLADLFKSDFSQHGNTDAIFGDPASGKPPDPSLDTGHYDDGHAFGWDIKSKADVIKVEHSIIDDIIEDETPKIVSDLEVASAMDLNGNGQIDQPGGSGQQVTTIVGPPVIT
jgi:hypothetical protein